MNQSIRRLLARAGRRSTILLAVVLVLCHASAAAGQTFGAEPDGVFSATNSRWRHARFSATDYRTHYKNYASAAGMDAERSWNAAHFTQIVGGQFDYKTRNPSIYHWVYDINVWHRDIKNGAQIGMEAWLRANGYDPENAFLHSPAGAAVPQIRDDTGSRIPAHTASGNKIKADRATSQQFANRDYWYHNLADPGFRAWRKHRTRQLVAGGKRDGIFFDVMHVSAITKWISFPTLEYATAAAYFADYRQVIAEQRPLVPAQRNYLNTAQYTNQRPNMENAKISGAVMCEFCNSPYRTGLYWDEIEELVAADVVVHYQAAVKTSRKNTPQHGATPGNYASVKERTLMFEYASYLMVVDPARMDHVVFDPYNEGWAQHPLSATWLTAYEYDIGLATSPRSRVSSGTDPLGTKYQIWGRSFEHAYVLIRRQISGTAHNHGDASAVTVDLPAGTWHVLQANGARGHPTTSVQLRTGEAVVLVR
jgi:hypothetical protein